MTQRSSRLSSTRRSLGLLRWMNAGGRVSSPRPGVQHDARLFAGTFASLCAYYLLWYAHFWPGVFDFDSGVSLNEVVTGHLTDQKPFLYARFLQAFSLGGLSFPVAVMTQIVIA